MNSKAPIVLYRFIRPLVLSDLNVIPPSYDKCGGITFYVEVNNEILSFSFSKCSNQKRFDVKIAKRHAQNRFYQNKVFQIPFKAQLSIIDNLVLGIANSDIMELKNLHYKMLSIIKHNHSIKTQFKASIQHINHQNLYFQ
jgi:uncharacterized protein YwqG